MPGSPLEPSSVGAPGPVARASLADRDVGDPLAVPQRNVAVGAREGPVEGEGDQLGDRERAVRLDRDVDVGGREGKGLRSRLAGSEEAEQGSGEERRSPQKVTRGASLAAGSSTSKYSRALKLNMFPTMFVGTVSSAVS